MQPVVLYSATTSSMHHSLSSTRLAAQLLRNLLSNKPSSQQLLGTIGGGGLLANSSSSSSATLAFTLLNRLKYILLSSAAQHSPVTAALTQHPAFVGQPPHPTTFSFATQQSQTSSFLYNLFNFNPTFPFSLSLSEYKRMNTSQTTLHLVTAYSGYSKEFLNNTFNTNIKRTELNETTSSRASAGARNKKGGVIGDDAWFITKQNSIDVLGVADGVGGWHSYGIDPSKFSFNLMKTCKRIVEQDFSTTSGSATQASRQETKPNKANRSAHRTAAEINSKTPLNLLEESYRTLLENKNSNLLVGSSTACILIFHHETNLLHTCNLGDSGFVIVRGNKIIHRSQEQQHYFNSPYQIAILPNNTRDLLSNLRDNMIEEEVVLEESVNNINNNTNSNNSRSSLINDSPELATSCSVELKEGDFIVVGTDGLWDNLTETHLLNEIAQIKVRHKL